MYKRALVSIVLTLNVYAGAFDQGSVNFGLTAGSGSVSNAYQTKYYTIVGINAGLFVIDGLNVGLGYRGWFGASPSYTDIVVPVTYYLDLDTVHPYVGLFYQYTIAEGNAQNYDSYGYRLGAALNLSDKSYAALGMVQEFYSTGGDNIYPELLIGFGF